MRARGTFESCESFHSISNAWIAPIPERSMVVHFAWPMVSRLASAVRNCSSCRAEFQRVAHGVKGTRSSYWLLRICHTADRYRFVMIRWSVDVTGPAALLHHVAWRENAATSA